MSNGLGGFAMGAAVGTPDRRYHSVLTTSLLPPVMRMNLVAALDEKLAIGNPGVDERIVALTPLRFVGAPESDPAACTCIHFEKHPARCRWTHKIETPEGTITIYKDLQLADGASAARVSYRIESDQSCRLSVRPLLAMRDFHALNHPGTIASDDLEIEANADGTQITRGELSLRLRVIDGKIAREDSVWKNILYVHEQDRGLDHAEDLYCPLAIESNANFTIELFAGNESAIDWDANESSKLARIEAMRNAASAASNLEDRNPLLSRALDSISRLCAAADDFVVRRDHDGRQATSILAGYPWFSDWGRDSMIALPGLLLVTGRHEEAFDTLRTFAAAQRRGLIPNRFDDRLGEAHYNTVDASLWFVHACAQYTKAANDEAGFREHLLGACVRVIDAYLSGTDYAIGVDPADGLVSAGNASTQLTWMDAQRDGITFTPRHGKAIEINALWINALNQLADLIEHDHPERAHAYRNSAHHASSSLQATMTGGRGGLVDCLTPTIHTRGTGWMRSDEIRPNQIFAASLPSVELDDHIATLAYDAVESHLWTAAGLRTLSSDDDAYCPIYAGPLIERDRAYHNGTVWPWLLGAHFEADLRVHNFDDASRERVITRVCDLVDEMDRASIGSIAEIYDAETTDGDRFQHARGCPAQAWSIAEALRVLVLACGEKR